MGGGLTLNDAVVGAEGLEGRLGAVQVAHGLVDVCRVRTLLPQPSDARHGLHVGTVGRKQRALYAGEHGTLVGQLHSQASHAWRWRRKTTGPG